MYIKTYIYYMNIQEISRPFAEIDVAYKLPD